jgi:hypothetical protein
LLKDIVLAFAGSFQVWKYEDSDNGECYVLGELMKQKNGAFAIPGKEYWTSFLSRKRVLLICAGEKRGYEINNVFE